MNGGRLSNDEAFLVGVDELKRQLAAAEPDGTAVERALTRIAVRYPEEAESLRELWRRPGAECTRRLDAMVAQHAAENDD